MSWPVAGIGRILSPRSVAGFDGEQGWDMGEPEGAGVIASQDRELRAGRAGVILTPDQRVRVFIFLGAGRARGRSVTVV
ncbi:MAG TPA: hypothetical protein VEG33_04305 [Streptosporangiaceae bacterium]|nr:hypothetical protein [Streptosporangiaceae bacterium]